MTRPRAREVALWIVAAFLGWSLYGEWQAVGTVEREVAEYALGSTSAAEAILADGMMRSENRAEDVERDARECVQTMKKREVH